MVTKSTELESVKVVSFDIPVTLYPFRFHEPVTYILPVKKCVSSSVSPNCVEPLVKSIEPETYSVWNSCAVKVPAIVLLPETDNSEVVD